MKSIKDRADAYRKEFLESFYKSLEEMSFYDISNAYITGAKEQEQITKQELIEKACNVYADLLSAHGYNPIDVNNEVVRMKKELEK